LADRNLQNLFFALWPDAVVRSDLVALQRTLPGSGGRMHHPDDLHMTLVFLGKVLQEQFPCIHDLAASIAARPFPLELTRVAYWKRPRILWCGPDQTPDPLQRLVHELQQGLIQCGFKPEERSYKPHVTLARKASPIPQRSVAEPVIWNPREFVLAGSHSGPRPPRYRVLERWGFDI
jgi:RNA 2',3'-cyclic 3'-phosphodiesterase